MKLNANGSVLTIPMIRHAHYEILVEGQRPTRVRTSEYQYMAWLSQGADFRILGESERREIDAGATATFAGMPIERDYDYPADTITFYQGDRIVGEITGLAHP